MHLVNEDFHFKVLSASHSVFVSFEL